MTEAIVSFATERVSNILIGEAVFLCGVREEVLRLKAELERIQCYLEDADNKQYQSELIRKLVAQVRDIAYEADDIIDFFLLKVVTREVSVCSLNRIKSLFTKGLHLHRVGNEIKSLRTRISDIANNMAIYNIKFDEGDRSRREMQRLLRRSYPQNEEEDVVILEDCTKDLMAQLMREEDRKRVVSIVGMGGLGKTTLAKKVFNKTEVKRHFDSCSWASVSQEFSIKRILIGILRDIAPEVIVGGNTEEGDELILKLSNVLKDRRYFVVLDDMWQNEAWDSLKPTFPKGKKGSKILLTTRHKDVALYADSESPLIELPFLSEKQSWDLFKSKTLPRDHLNENGNISQEMEKIAKEMVRKCGGLPLAIVVLGGLLKTKKSTIEWEDVHKKMITQFIKMDVRQQYGGVFDILALSYQSLPWNLKPCFLYLSVFPEDGKINKKSLVRMWIAEGFISQSVAVIRNETLEDVGDEYFEELIHRSMIQVSTHVKWGIFCKMYRLHDLMRDMCVSKAREENFLKVVGDHRSRGLMEEAPSTSSIISRRISIHDTDESPRHYLSKIKCDAHLRALFRVSSFDDDPMSLAILCISQFDGFHELTKVNGRVFSKNFGLLRVIHIEEPTLVRSVPKEIGHLIHLRYLRWLLSGSLPTSIGNLRILHTLDLRSGPMKAVYTNIKLPDVLWKLECLRHFLVSRGNEICCRVDTLRNLETLKWIRAEFLLKNDAMLKLTNLRDLRVLFSKTDEVEIFLRSRIVGHLRSLIMEIPDAPFPSIESISRLRHLQKIKLDGKILEDVHSSQLKFLPTCLSKVTFRGCWLRQDPMPILEKLPNLTSLGLLWETYKGSQMMCSARGFPAL